MRGMREGIPRIIGHIPEKKEATQTVVIYKQIKYNCIT